MWISTMYLSFPLLYLSNGYAREVIAMQMHVIYVDFMKAEIDISTI